MEKKDTAETVVSFRISQKTLKSFGEIAKASHRTVSDALRLLVDQTVREKALPEARK